MKNVYVLQDSFLAVEACNFYGIEERDDMLNVIAAISLIISRLSIVFQCSAVF
jgi:hypothetical protein